MTLVTERNVTDNWKRNGSEHGLPIMAGDSPKTNCSRDARRVEAENWKSESEMNVSNLARH